MAYKHCAACYRIIKGVRYQQWTDCADDFAKEIAECKKLGLRYRIIQGRMFREVR